MSKRRRANSGDDSSESKGTVKEINEEKIIFLHRKTREMSCFCGYTGTYHKCKVSYDTEIRIDLCPDDCTICTEIEEKEEYDDERFYTNYDGYLVCAKCQDNISTICECCFCTECWEENHDGEECKTKRKYT